METRSSDPADEGLLCPACGYDLRGSASDRCSECGKVIDREELRRSGFWFARVGWVKGYFFTVGKIIGGSRKLRNEAGKKQDLARARWFGRMTALLLGLIMVGCYLAVLGAAGGWIELAIRRSMLQGPSGVVPGWEEDLLVPWMASATTPWILPCLMFWLAFRMVAALQFGFRAKDASPERRQTLEAISCYTSAPLVLLALGIAAFGMAAVVGDKRDTSELQVGVIVTGQGICFIALLVMFLRLGQWVARVKHSAMSGLLAVFWLAALWIWEAVLLLGIVPWCAGLAWIAIDSFR